MKEQEKLPVIIQHYISQGILRLFSENKKSVFEFNIQNGNIYRTGIRKTMSDTYTYEHPFLPGNALENAFKTIEDKYIPQMTGIVNMLDSEDVLTAKKRIEELLEYILLFYYRSGAVLYEFSDNNEFEKAEVIENLLKRITDLTYLNRLARTIINDYKFVVVKSSESKLLLSDQYVSTASLNCKGKIANYANRTIGFSNCLIMIPLSAKYYIVYYNGSFPLSKAIDSNKIYELTEMDLFNLNKVIIRNSYRKCVAMHQDELETVKEYKSATYGPTGTIMKYSDGSFHSYTVKKEVFYRDIDADIFEHFVDYCSNLIRFEETHNRSLGRNDLCPCGSNKKFKKCCIEKYQQSQYIYNMLKSNDTSWMCTKSNFVEKPINAFWGLDTDLPKSAQKILKGLREMKDNRGLKI